MRAFLLYCDRDFETEWRLPSNSADVSHDLGLDTLCATMGRGDNFLTEVARRVLLSSLIEPSAIIYRQRILHDCMQEPETVRKIYALAVEAITGEKKIWRIGSSRSPRVILNRSVQVLQLFIEILTRLCQLVDGHASGFSSEGFSAFFAALTAELSDEYFATVANHLRRLRFRDGVLLSSRLGTGCKGTDYTLRSPNGVQAGWFQRITATKPPAFSMRVSPRDEAGLQAMEELRGQGINLAANALAQSTDHILSFFTMLRQELGFYIGCLNAWEVLSDKGEPVCFPVPVSAKPHTPSSRGLYDISLSLRLQSRVVANDIQADGRSLVVITGANQGGKSTFLRSLGLAQLLTQAGMFAPAEFFAASVCEGLFTHYKREEDATMTSGKLDEELSRMNEIVNHVSSGSIILFNESFAATNEREGSEIARQIIRALLQKGIRVICVTHLFALAHSLYQAESSAALFLRAERHEDGQRTFRVVEGEPLPTSYGQDLYRRIFGGTSEVVRSAPTRDPSDTRSRC